MNNFLDTCLIIGYANAGIFNQYEKYEEYAKNKKDKFYVCYFVLEKDLPSLKERYLAMFSELKKNNPDFLRLVQENILFKKDVNFAKKLLILKDIALKRGINILDFLSKAEEIIQLRIDFFIANLIDRKIVPINEIDNELKSSIFTWTNNISDSKTLASGVQFHNNDEEIIMVTGDRTDWTKENLENSVSIHPTLRLKYRKIPEIKYL